jgi:hypothetical protein
VKIRFQADNDLHEDIMRSLRRAGSIDFQRAPTLGLHMGILDPEVLRLCVEQNRMLVTHDRKTMPVHFADFIQDHDSPGIFVVSRKLSIGAAAEWLLLYWEVTEAEEHRNSLIYIP